MRFQQSHSIKSCILLCLLSLCCSVLPAVGQCPIQNRAFSDNEMLTYSLHFNWKFIWLKAGQASMHTQRQKQKGTDGYQSQLITHTNKKIDKFFMMRDTLHCFVNSNLVPLYYKKAAAEGGKYYLDEVEYHYTADSIHLTQHAIRKGKSQECHFCSKECLYDMMSLLLYTRSLDVTGMKVGDKMCFPMADGRKVETATLIYRGKKNFKSDEQGITYRCLVFSLVEYEKKKEKEIITFYITDDENHVPVRLDLFLRFGTAKAFLSNAEGLRHPSTSIVKKK